MNVIKFPWVKALILSTITIVVLLVLQIFSVTVPNAFFFLGAIAALVILAIIFYRCNANCIRGYFFISAIALLIYAVVLSFFVVEGSLVLMLVPFWIGLFLIWNLLFTLLECHR